MEYPNSPLSRYIAQCCSPFNHPNQIMVGYRVYSENPLFVGNYLMLLGMLWLEFRRSKSGVLAMPPLMNRCEVGICSAGCRRVKGTAW